MEWTIDLPMDTTYRFVTHFATEESLIYPMQIDVNGIKEAEFQLKRLPDMTWFVYKDDSNFEIARLKSGKSLIRLSSSAMYAPNMDHVKIMVTNPFVSVSSLMLDVNSITILKLDSFKLNATIAPSTATDNRVLWTSSKASVATVKNGMVKGVAIGTANITATSVDGSKVATCIVTVTERTGVETMKTNDLIKVYPNPAKNELFVNLAEMPGDDNADIRLYNSLSSMVMNLKTNKHDNGGIFKFDTSTLPDGIYLLQITLGNKVETRKVVISK